ncbi:exopolyphosphatase [Sporobolomyces koalae]|uniref:exopolyphosphatase n=1 Tax=Sporobolomyces koalae TaxID=500713 RepID=UPI00317D2E5F
MSDTATLDQYLRDTRSDFLGRNSEDAWVVVMGNEAGDLDSLASSIAYAYFASVTTTPPRKFVPLQLTPRADLSLRPENLASLSDASIELGSLLTIDDLPSPPSTNNIEFVLVDHNSLLPMFADADKDDADSDRVIAVIDHHVDEHQHEYARPRVIEPTGSCASLVTTHFLASNTTTFGPDNTPAVRQLANLLLDAILIDTRLKPSSKGGKTTDTDTKAVTLLRAQLDPNSESNSLNVESLQEELSSRADRLLQLKENVQGMNSRDLLRRDYKQYVATDAAGRLVKYGLSTVPLGLEVWLMDETFERGHQIEGLVREVERWMDERGLALAGVLTSYTHVKHKTGDSKHRRELLVVTRDARFDDVLDALNRQESLDLRTWKGIDDFGGIDHGRVQGEANMQWKVWQQHNTKATRKQVAPIVKDLVEGALQ